MIIYISGLNSVHKDWIDENLKTLTDKHQYLLYRENFKDYNIEPAEEDITIIAHSMGAMTALDIYRKYPDKIKSIHLINPTLKIFDKDVDVFKRAPLTIHLGIQDEILQMVHILNNIKIHYIKTIEYPNLKHRFNEIEFIEILNNIKPYLNVV